ncbi:MAG: sigma-70 family RNA polymerase sigma factor [Verrucomicrobiales bacterium]|nr:sigma-70 family RNA polymerase sigma factor [Verrucomicrobiales bacterium]
MQNNTISAIPDSGELDPKSDTDFTELVNRHHRELLVYARALTRDPATARDIVQEAFIVAYEKVNTFDVTRDFATWMRGIVRNKWREWLRKNRRYALSDHEIAQIDADVAVWQSEKAEDESDLFGALRDCINRLPENLNEAIAACYYEGRTGDEASDHLGISSAAVRKRLQRARILLKKCLDRKISTTSSESS